MRPTLHKLKREDFPLTIEFEAAKTGQIVHRIEVAKPETVPLRIPGLSGEYGPIRVRFLWPDGSVTIEEPSFTCPQCHMTSHNLNDVEHGYCGNCHDWTGERH